MLWEEKKGEEIEEIKNESLEGGKDIVEVRKRLVKALSVADDTYSKWTKNIRDEYDKQIKSQIIQEYLKADLTQQQVAEKFEVSINYIYRNTQEINEKINLLFHLNPHDFFENLPKKTQDKFLKEHTTEKERKENMEISFNTFYDRLKGEYKELSSFKAKPYNIRSYRKQEPADTATDS